MIIHKYYGVKGARLSNGLTIIIDVFRAATVSAFLLQKKVKYIIPVSTKEEALILKKQNENYILVGEEKGYKIPGFDIGNSPFEILSKNLNNRIVVHRSSMGTQGLIQAKNASELIFGSFVCSQAIIDYIKKKMPMELSIVAMDGLNSEDAIFADYLINKIRRYTKKNNIKSIINRLKTHSGSTRFLDNKIPEFPIEDFYLCLDLNRFDFFPLIIKDNGLLKIKKFKT